MYFLVLGLAQQVALSWLLKDGYGALRGALSPASITYNPLVTSGIQGLSWAVSRNSGPNQKKAVREALALHAGLAAFTSLAFYLAAPSLGRWLNSEYLVPSFRILSLVVLFYGIYAPIVGILNGQRRFLLQAGLDALAATLRSVALFGGAWWLLKEGTTRAVEGATWGFSLVAFFLIPAAALVAFRRPKEIAVVAPKSAGAASTLGSHLSFIFPVILSQVVLNLLLQADTNTLRGFATRAAVAEGLEPTAADVLVGAYNAGQLFGFLPYQLLIGITFILFPMLTKAHADGDREAVARFVATGVRVALIVGGLVVAVSAGLAKNLLLLVFPANFSELGGDAAELLMLGLGLFAMFGVFATVLNSVGKQWLSLMITASALGLVFVLNWTLVRDAGFGPELLNRTALATSIGIAAATLLAGGAVRLHTGALVPPLCVARVLTAVALCAWLGRQLPTLGRPVTVVASAGLALTYVLFLVLSKELGRGELGLVSAVIGKRR